MGASPVASWTLYQADCFFRTMRRAASWVARAGSGSLLWYGPGTATGLWTVPSGTESHTSPLEYPTQLSSNQTEASVHLLMAPHEEKLRKSTSPVLGTKEADTITSKTVDPLDQRRGVLFELASVPLHLPAPIRGLEC